MRKRTAATGAGAVGLAVLGLMYLPDFEFGSLGVPQGEGDELTLNPTADDADVPPAPRFDEEGEELENGGDGPADAETAAADPGEAVAPGAAGPVPEDDQTDGAAIAVADVLVDGGDYLVLKRFASDGLPIREGMSLTAVLDFAARMGGAPDGVKVRVARTPDAFAGAVTDLTAALANAGFEEDEIDYRTKLVTDAE